MKDRMPERTLTLLELWPEDPEFHLNHYAAKCIREAYTEIDAKEFEIQQLKWLMPKLELCKWEFNESDGYWATDCDNAFLISDGGPEENDMKYCPYCGRLLKEVKPEPTQEEAEEGDE